MSRNAAAALTAGALVILVFVVFGRTSTHAVIDYDDPYYVTENAVVAQGLTAGGAIWAVTTTDYFYWHPLTWFSHMLDCQRSWRRARRSKARFVIR